MFVLSRETGDMVKIVSPVELAVIVISINGESVWPNLPVSDEVDQHDEGIRQRICNPTDRLPPNIAQTRGGHS